MLQPIKFLLFRLKRRNRIIQIFHSGTKITSILL
ncbi:hypothetical protein FGIG_09361 [Fasciola gigantica]|uniref:Uncharacterized protein n=1 Tax=Fasciola gigantica TaxID=46835 RepID=A0A504YGW8_FASGI|nr:hypothetical protein FGIG_09361 [Fasciola gigantica]